MNIEFQIIVIGAGHAGCEAAHAAARMGLTTLLITQNLDTIGHMSCNPAIGGIGKGHLVREIDALGGLMGRIADQSGIQFRLLNRGKGPAVRGPRAQMDRMEYRTRMRHALEATPNLTIRQAEATQLLQDGQRIIGVATDWGESYTTRAVVLTTGTFLRGLAHVGERTFPAGRMGDRPSLPLAESLQGLGIAMGRLKTGTPPRLDGRTIRWEILEEQTGDPVPEPFSFLTDDLPKDQVSCYITHTNPGTHAAIRTNLHRAPMYSGQILGIGPRYCPSIEDKVVRFSEREHHQIFLEPEGRRTHEVYPNGISTSLPIDVQWQVVRSIRGLEEVMILRPGYAIEYDMVDPRQLDNGLALKGFPGLYLAGQINGTTGYEEAAALGLVAGINAARFAQERDPIHFDRSTGYLGVMIDDLILRGVDEPYRMFTSRAEFRLLLRIDNADARLTPIGREIGLVDEVRWQRFIAKQAGIQLIRRQLHEVRISMRAYADLVGLNPQDFPESARQPLWELLRRNEVAATPLVALGGLVDLPSACLEVLEVEAIYQGFLDRQEEEVARFRRSESLQIPLDLDWEAVTGLSVELRQKLRRVNPATVGQANRVPGITPAAITALLVHLRKLEARPK